MPKIGCDKTVKRVIPVLYIVDTSKSMEQYQEKIVDVINKSINWITENSEDVDVMVSILTFSSRCEWVMVNECNPIGITIEDLHTYYGGSDVSFALKELSKRLSRSDLLAYMNAPLKPTLFFLSDSEFSKSFSEGLIEAKKNQWFMRSLKVGVGFGDKVNRSMMSELTGNEGAVFDVKMISMLERVIKSTYYGSDIVMDYQFDENIQRENLSDTSGKWQDDWDDEWDIGMEGRDAFSSIRDGLSIQQSMYTQFKKAKKVMEIEDNEAISSASARIHVYNEEWE